jgi:hypothetical protein
MRSLAPVAPETPLRRLLIVPAVLFVVASIGMAWFVIWANANAGGTIPVSLASSAVARGWAVSVSGTTNLPDGALLQLQASGASWTWTGVAEVSGGQFTAAFDATPLGPGEATVTVTFSMNDGPAQPASLVDEFGADGSGIGGPQVVYDPPGGSPKVRVAIRLVLPGPSAG